MLLFFRCCLRTLSNPRATLTARLESHHALTSVSIWDQDGKFHLSSDNHWDDLSIGFGTMESLTGCMIVPDPHFWKPHPAGYERKGLLCGNTGDFVAVSVSELMANASTMPACKPLPPFPILTSQSIASVTPPDPGTAGPVHSRHRQDLLQGDPQQPSPRDWHHPGPVLRPQVLRQRRHGPRPPRPPLVQGQRPHPAHPP